MGVGYHRTTRGVVEKYKSEKRLAEDTERKYENSYYVATQALLDAFRGHGAGVEEYETIPFLPRTTKGKARPAGAASIDLGTSAHFDVSDAFRCWSGWGLAQPEVGEPEEWWLLFPDVGLAIRLCHGALVSWDGRVQRHCSSVPVGLPVGQHLYSFFVGIGCGVAKVARAQQEWEWASEADGVLAALPLAARDVVWVKWHGVGRGDGMGRGDVWRRRVGVVESVGAEGVAVTLEDKSVPFVISWDRVKNCVVRAGAITRACELCGEALVGLRVCVFWAADDACYYGCVTAFDGVRHTVVYDDGDVQHEVLPCEDTPSYRVVTTARSVV